MSCQTEVRLVGGPSLPVQVRGGDPVSLLVTTEETTLMGVVSGQQTFPLSDDGNFIRLPVRGGGTALVPYSPA